MKGNIPRSIEVDNQSRVSVKPNLWPINSMTGFPSCPFYLWAEVGQLAGSSDLAAFQNFQVIEALKPKIRLMNLIRLCQSDVHQIFEIPYMPHYNLLLI